MRIRALLATACMVGVSMLFTAAASAASEIKKTTTYDVYGTICDWGAGPNYRYWADATAVHELDTWHVGPQYVLIKGRWVDAGTFRADIAEAVWGSTWGHNQGTITMLDTPIGDIYSSFYWDWSTNGTATGTSAYRNKIVQVTTEILLEDPIGLPAPPPDGCKTGGDVPGHRYLRITVPNAITPGPA